MIYAAGRALAFARMAADAHGRSGNEPLGGQRVAEYHAYAGVSACRTALDATANWLRIALFRTMSPGVSVDIAKAGFRRKIVAARPRAEPQLHPLASWLPRLTPCVRQPNIGRACLSCTVCFATKVVGTCRSRIRDAFVSNANETATMSDFS
jgi:hypothetical protein